MGLCKCERRRVTNLFCFEHRVNVCEFCLTVTLIPHAVYVVNRLKLTLLKNAYVCKSAINVEVFLDVYHWDCLNNYVLSLPPTTTPAGFLCPLCDQPIIPQANHGGPVAEALRTCLSEVDWAKGSLNEIRKYFTIEPNPRVNSTPSMYTPTQSKCLYFGANSRHFFEHPTITHSTIVHQTIFLASHITFIIIVKLRYLSIYSSRS
ncbi:unnamed protein product [Trichobilharzia regenti]|nr:unnamed protein product [Trichobilharzia regenti]